MRALAAFAALLLAACASYEPSPLPERDALARDPAQLRVDAAAMPTPTLRAHRFDPADGLDMTEVAMLAVANNPELKMLRAEAGVTRAQAFSAGLLPDPQLTLSSDRVLGSPAGSTVALGAGLSFDIAALLARSSTQAAATAEVRKTDLNLLWQEWQTVAKARLLFVKTDSLDRSLALIDPQRAAWQQRFERLREAVAHGLVTSDAATPQLTALQDLNRQRNDLERQRNQTRHDLNALLGVDPGVELRLVGSPDVATLDEGEVHAALATAAQRRPDLLALQAGYAAQDDAYRGALQAQFPAITFGPTRARDTSNVDTAGLSLSISLPLFNRNRGHIAIELATREKLRIDIQQRLDATVGDAHRLEAEQATLVRQRAGIDVAIDVLAQAASRAQHAFTASQIDALVLTNVEGAVLARQLDRIAIDQALWEQAIALQALVGGELTASNSPPEASP